MRHTRGPARRDPAASSWWDQPVAFLTVDDRWVRPRFVDDFIAALQAIKAAGLTPALLSDYLP